MLTEAKLVRIKGRIERCIFTEDRVGQRDWAIGKNRDALHNGLEADTEETKLPRYPTSAHDLLMSDNLSFVLRGIEDVAYEQRSIPLRKHLSSRLLSG